MSYSKNVLGLKVLESVEYIERGLALTIELFNNEACIRPATSNDTVVGIALENYTRGVDNLNGDKISVSIIEFSPGIAGVNIEAGNLLSVNDSGKFIVSDKNILGVAITNGKLGELFQFVRIFSKEGSGSGGVSSVNGMSGDVLIEANNILANVDNSMKQGAFNNAMNDAVNFLGEELEKKQNIIDDALITTDKTVVGAINELKAGGSVMGTATILTGFNTYHSVLCTKSGAFCTVRIGIEVTVTIPVQTRKQAFILPAGFTPNTAYYTTVVANGGSTGPNICLAIEVISSGSVYVQTADVQVPAGKYIFGTLIFPVA